jgi:hypothetical protein
VAVGSGVGVAVGIGVAVGGAGEIEQAMAAMARHAARAVVRLIGVLRSWPDPVFGSE